MGRPTRKLRKSVHTPEHEALLGLLVNTRKRAGLTQQKLAKALGRPQSFVAKYENGERRLDVIEFIAIARAMRVEPVRLVKALLKQMP